jgi:hypothetical protein
MFSRIQRNNMGACALAYTQELLDMNDKLKAAKREYRDGIAGDGQSAPQQ